LTEDIRARLIVDAIFLMELSAFAQNCKIGGAGNVPFAPAVLLTLLIYAYSHGVWSNRGIERLCWRDAGRAGMMFRCLLLGVCREAGLIRLGLEALDGIKANVNRSVNRADGQIARMMAETEATDTQEGRPFGAEDHGEAMPRGVNSWATATTGLISGRHDDLATERRRLC
jgi:hypothetical protein